MQLGDGIKAFISKPYSSDMDVWAWILFLGFVTVISLMWASILGEIKGE